jgi:hypothetical protein
MDDMIYKLINFAINSVKLLSVIRGVGCDVAGTGCISPSLDAPECGGFFCCAWKCSGRSVYLQL